MAFKALLATVMILIAGTISCSVSTNDLAAEVKQNMALKLNPEGISVTSLILTKKGGNVYSGVLDTKEPEGEFTYTVEVIYDGQNMTWEIKQ